MNRMRHFIMFQRAAWRALFRRRGEPIQIPAPDPNEVTHPSQLCRCFGRPATMHDALEEHKPDCPWLAVMCTSCNGIGRCSMCGGDGVESHVNPYEYP